MFLGTIPRGITAIMHELSGSWNTKEVFIGCSGNFTIERTLKDRNLKMHSNDVSLYTSALGTFFSKQEPLKAEIRPAFKEVFGFLDDYIHESADLAVTLMLCTDMLEGLNRQNPYYERKRHSYISQWKELHAETKKKLEAVDLHVEDYFCGDVMEMIKALPKECAFCAFPPFWKGGYERLYKHIDAVFSWNAPTYEMFDPKDALKVMFDRARECDHWILGTMERLNDYEENLVGMSKNDLKGVMMYLYSDQARSRLDLPHQNLAPLFNERMTENEVITPESKVTLSFLDLPRFNQMRSTCLDSAITPSNPFYSLAILVDGRIIGACAYSFHGFADWQNLMSGPQIYLMSDFAIPGTRYARLSKLVLYCILSKEAQEIAQYMTKTRIRGVVTTAFSKRDQSMKYRGLFDVLSKKLVDGPRPHQLNYGSLAGRWTLSEGLAEWLKRFGDERHGEEDD